LHTARAASTDVGGTDVTQLSFDELAEERWIPVPGYEGFYDVSDLGRVRSLPRTTTRGGVLNPSTVTAGYFRVSLSRLGVITEMLVHQVVCLAFVGPRPDGLEVRHLDGNCQNNALGNLEYGTRSENAFDRVRHGTHRNTRKTHCPNGHEYTPENTVIHVGGNGREWRRCLTCKLEQRRERYQRHLRARKEGRAA
jgi:HNH endonuclease/NUMOD4 motif